MAEALVGLRASIHAAAEANVSIVTAEDEYSLTEVQAMTLVEELRQVNGLDLAAVLLRADLLRQIETTNAIINHPAGYQNMREMASDQGISLSELSNTLDWVNIIFPFITEQLGLPLAQVWENVGKSKLREITPVLKAIIEGPDTAGRGTVQRGAEAILNDVAATFAAAGREATEEEIVIAAAEQIIENGENLTVQELRTTIRPDRTPNIQCTFLRDRDQQSGVIILEVDNEDQLVMFRNRMSGHFDVQVNDLPPNQYERQRIVHHVPGIHRILTFRPEATEGQQTFDMDEPAVVDNGEGAPF